MKAKKHKSHPDVLCCQPCIYSAGIVFIKGLSYLDTGLQGTVHCRAVSERLVGKEVLLSSSQFLRKLDAVDCPGVSTILLRERCHTFIAEDDGRAVGNIHCPEVFATKAEASRVGSGNRDHMSDLATRTVVADNAAVTKLGIPDSARTGVL